MPRDIKDTVEEFIELIETKEESINGRSFYPVTLSSCRILMSRRLHVILDEMREFIDVQK
jgi:hypothetical protein